MYETEDQAMSNSKQNTELRRKLQEELKNKSLRDLESQTEVSRGSIDNIVRGENVGYPTLETLDKLATYWGLPVWRVIEMAGIDLGMPRSADETALQLKSLMKRLPELELVVQALLTLYHEDVRGVVAYLEALDRQRNLEHGWSNDAPGPHQ